MPRGKLSSLRKRYGKSMPPGGKRLPLPPCSFGSLEARCEWSLRRDLRRVIHPLRRLILGPSRPQPSAKRFHPRWRLGRLVTHPSMQLG